MSTTQKFSKTKQEQAKNYPQTVVDRLAKYHTKEEQEMFTLGARAVLKQWK